MFKAINLLLVFLAVSSLNAQGVREHTRQNTTDPARLRYRLGDNTKANGTAVSEEQASDVTLTLNAVSVRPIQTWVRTAGRIDKTRKIVNAIVHAPESTYVKVGQRVRAFPPESKSSMLQAWVTKVTPRPDGVMVEVTLSGIGHPDSLNYVMEIVTERGEFLSIPNEAIIEEGTKHIVYVPREAGQYAPMEVETGIQGELYTAVQKGLKDGDQVVSFGSFFIDSEYKLKSGDQTAADNDQQHH
jgi:multidrug efflux pump subunit AcrA (membrane-fusion protein)